MFTQEMQPKFQKCKLLDIVVQSIHKILKFLRLSKVVLIIELIELILI